MAKLLARFVFWVSMLCFQPGKCETAGSQVQTGAIEATILHLSRVFGSHYTETESMALPDRELFTLTPHDGQRGSAL